MASNQDRVTEFYAGGKEDARATLSRSGAQEFYYTEKFLRRLLKPEMRVLELGCATGYYAFRLADSCAEYVGIDLSPENIAIFNEKLKSCNKSHISASIGDATCLKNIDDASFDAVFCLGPIYHLPKSERELVFAEVNRVLRPSGVAAFAYISALGVYAGAVTNSKLRQVYPNADCNRAALVEGHDDINSELFFFTSPEEIETAAESHGFETLANNGLDFFFASEAIDSLDETRFEYMRELLDCMCESTSCVGLANHALLSCKKL